MQPSDKINEEYYQISQAILTSFPKYRLPLDLFRFKVEVGQLQLHVKKGTRMSNEQVELTHELCLNGNLFVSREDFPIYSQHIIEQLDLVLVDANLKEHEIADITLGALELRLGRFFEQPVSPVYEVLYENVQVVTEYLWLDRHRIRQYWRRLRTGDHTLINQAVNTFIVGIWLLCRTAEDLRRREFDRVVMGLLLHDVGMTKVPSFILNKTTPLRREEWEKIPPHVQTGAKVLQKIDVVHDEIMRIVLEHHERLDGVGYPLRLAGNNISRHGRLAAVADSFAAMIQNRPYAKAKPPQEVARSLATDKEGYDQKFTAPLLAAYALNDFSLP